MAIKNFEDAITYNPNGTLIVSPDTIDIVDADRSETGYSYFDEAVNGDYEHFLTVRTASTSSLGAAIYNWVLGNGVGDFTSIKNLGAHSLFRLEGGALVRLQLFEHMIGGVSYNTSWSGNVNTIYYLKFDRDISIGSFGQLNCFVYTDEGLTVLVKILTLDLHENIDFTKAYPVCGEGVGITGEQYDGYVKNFDTGDGVTVVPLTRRGLGRGLNKGIGKGF